MFAKTIGLIAAPHTPMDASGDVRLERIDDQIDLLVRNALAGAFVCGTTGEGPSLTTSERMAVAQRWAEAAPEGFRVIVHVGHQSLRDSRDLAAHAAGCGAFAIGSMPPTFFRALGTDDLADYLARVAAAAPRLPFYYYHIPSMTGVHVPMRDLLAATALRAPNLAGMKFTHRDIADFTACLAIDDGRYDCLFGIDEMLLSAVAIGARGAVGTTYNFAAPLYGRLIDAFERGDIQTARACQQQSVRMVAIGKRYGPFTAVSKAMMRILGLDLGPVRPPLQTISDEQFDQLRRELSEMGFTKFCCK